MGPGGKGTTTGKTFEHVIQIALLDNGYPVRTQVVVGKSLYGGKYKADFVVKDIIISCKWQQVPGTAEQKIIYDVASLIKIIKESNGKYTKAYVVLGGEGFSANAVKYLTSQSFRDLFVDGHLIEVLDLNKMLAKINKGEI